MSHFFCTILLFYKAERMCQTCLNEKEADISKHGSLENWKEHIHVHW